ncbi:hypothetical protein Hanom_Chr05g00476401 [Helianthus anomalus]
MPLTLQSFLMHLHSTVQSNDLKKTAVKGQYGKLKLWWKYRSQVSWISCGYFKACGESSQCRDTIGKKKEAE